MPEIAPLPGVPGAAGPILVVGTAVVDRVVRLGAPLVAGGKLDGAGRGARLGGGAANAAVALARAGHPVRLVATLGADAAGDRVAAELRDAGVDIGLLRRAPGATPETLVLVDPSGERTIVRAAADPPAPLPEGLRAAAASCIFARGDAPGLAGLLRQRCSSCLVVAHVPPGGAGARPAHVLVGGASDLDASFLADPLEAGRRAAGDALRWVVVTRGAAGAEGFGIDGIRLTAPAPAVRPVDTTGAGDVFAAGLIHALLAGAPMERALRCAVAWGTAAVAWEGARPGPGFPPPDPA